MASYSRVLEVDRKPPPRPARSSGGELEVLRDQRVVEGVVARRNRHVRTLDRSTALELVKSDADPRVVQPGERFLEAGVADERSDVAELDARRVEERTVRAARVRIDRPIEDRQKRLVASAELLLEAAPRLFARERLPEEAGQPPRVADERAEIISA